MGNNSYTRVLPELRLKYPAMKGFYLVALFFLIVLINQVSAACNRADEADCADSCSGFEGYEWACVNGDRVRCTCRGDPTDAGNSLVPFAAPTAAALAIHLF